MVEESEVRSALVDVAALVQADGGDLELVSVDTATGMVALRLLLESANCAECVLPRAMLEGVATGMFQRSLPEVTGISIDDPRDDPGYEAH
ncbi:MAG TPA: NifU family protein [Acidimicrobiales bacterium]|jgi:Fe-S cluster biogenesis protein NfuA|nr:NifU family protein [Acidimicrobiales bacterium]